MCSLEGGFQKKAFQRHVNLELQEQWTGFA